MYAEAAAARMHTTMTAMLANKSMMAADDSMAYVCRRCGLEYAASGAPWLAARIRSALA